MRNFLPDLRESACDPPTYKMATRISSIYQLSTEILHTGDIRAVCAFEVEGEPDDYIVIASRDKTAC